MSKKFYLFNGLGQLQRVRDGNNASANVLEEYLYDANGDRIKINRYSYSGETNETIYTPYKEWMQIRNSSGTFNFYYIYQDSVLVSRLNSDGTKYYYHNDHLGSTTLITDENGNVVENEFYSAYGESLTTNNAEKNKLFTGQFKDNLECQYYYGARFFNPCYGMFIQPDLQIQNTLDPQNLNRYAYVRNNPYKLIDPTGKNYRVYADKNAVYDLGHIAIGVDNPYSSKQQIIFENTGLAHDIKQEIKITPYSPPVTIYDTKSDIQREILSFFNGIVTNYDAVRYNYQIGRNEKPEGYEEFYEIEQDISHDIEMIRAGADLEENPWKYNAAFFSSTEYAIFISQKGLRSIKIKWNTFFPYQVFNYNKGLLENEKKSDKQRSQHVSVGGGIELKPHCFVKKDPNGCRY